MTPDPVVNFTVASTGSQEGAALFLAELGLDEAKPWSPDDWPLDDE